MATPSGQTPADLRIAPVQARSAARLDELLDAAAGVIDEVGYERLTTAMVASRAGASIGTVYRYFPDRIAVLQALARRHLERVADRVGETVRDDEHSTWWDAYEAVLDVFIDAYRNEPGFRSLRFGDGLDVRPPAEVANNERIAAVLTDALHDRFGGGDDDEVRYAVRVSVEIADALVSRAFAAHSTGDERLISSARDILKAHLSLTYGEPVPA
ncbi:TetR/AcrR family transcriptional regulator [Herbiconiux sp. SYSU D00978]|uniref:TetR/AcrR family transcriptional regulator n=1 Tax=Herbiconiux sp. SYSU D00978 TaxID=2812562 RepID=UPI001A959BCD|nr:TetR/AcrR family transcriptional regulator [Herbiconiux sp. SYSU D00978]